MSAEALLYSSAEKTHYCYTLILTINLLLFAKNVFLTKVFETLRLLTAPNYISQIATMHGCGDISPCILNSSARNS